MDISPIYYIAISSSKHALLGLLRLRVILDDREIYELKNGKTLLIEVKKKEAVIIVTDGHHSSKPVRLTFSSPSYYHLRVDCLIEEAEIYLSLGLVCFLYLMGFITDQFLLKISGFAPVIYLLARYLAIRKIFLRIGPA